MTLEIRQLTPLEIKDALDEIAALRIKVFREWPYLYDGDLAYERHYLAPLASGHEVIVVGAFADDKLVGASNGMPLTAHADDFSTAFSGSDICLDEVFYCAESVLLPAHRGQGVGHRFFDLREAFARSLGYNLCTFCAVQRQTDHPSRPEKYRPLDAFWRARGYTPLAGVTAKFDWKDVGDEHETAKSLQFWARVL